MWDKPTDTFTFEISALAGYRETMRHPTSLRVVLSIIARMYDVFGFVSPVTITARILMQNVWKRKLEWDQELPNEMKKEFWTWFDALEELVGPGSTWKRSPTHRAPPSYMSFAIQVKRRTAR